MKTTLEILTEARAKISTLQTWTQNAYARDKFGEPVNQWSSSACKWCAMGALDSVTSGSRLEISGAVDSLREAGPVASVVTFNDYHSHEEVLALFDRAIANEKQKAQQAA